MIKVNGLYHAYKKDDNFAVNDISFQVNKGEIFGFLGPSGAGKSTTQGILTGLLPLQKGQVSLAGYDMRHPKKALFNKIGMSFEQANVYHKMTALENLNFYQKLFDVPTRDPMQLLKSVGLDDKANTRAGDFSKGMKHRLTFARSLINSPEILFLDEPTTGLDPGIAAIIKKMIRQENKNDVTIFLTTHNMFIADELCDRVAFIIDGKINIIDSPKNLKLQYGDKLVDIEYVKNGQAIIESYSTQIESDKHRIAQIIENETIITMHTKEATLEEIFIKVTGRGLD